MIERANDSRSAEAVMRSNRDDLERRCREAHQRLSEAAPGKSRSDAYAEWEALESQWLLLHKLTEGE